jgi:hypothetical protein
MTLDIDRDQSAVGYTLPASGSSASWPVGSRSAWRRFVWIEHPHSNPLEAANRFPTQAVSSSMPVGLAALTGLVRAGVHAIRLNRPAVSCDLREAVRNTRPFGACRRLVGDD